MCWDRVRLCVCGLWIDIVVCCSCFSVFLFFFTDTLFVVCCLLSVVVVCFFCFVARVLHIGTIYPDTIESGGAKHAKVIKTHHNRVPLIEQMIADGRVSEPLKELYKTEVRALARQLGVPLELLSRHPFPGPGLGVRLLCSKGGNLSPNVEQELTTALASFPTLSGVALPIKSVGVKADVRSYEHPVLLSSSNPSISFEDLLEATRIILRDVPHVNRVVYNLGGTTTPSTFTSLAATMTKDRLDLLRECDDYVSLGVVSFVLC